MRISAIVLVAGVSWLSGCESPAQQEGVTESFAALYAEVLVPRGCVGCHDADAPGGLDMTSAEGSYHALVGTPAEGSKCAPMGTLRVAPGDSNDSLLVHKLEGHDAASQPVCGKPMPQKQQLEAAEIERIRDWIDQGAEMGNGE